MKRVLLSITALLVLLCGIAVAEEVSIVASGECGKYGSNVTWALDSEGTLTILGEEKMKDFYSNDPPWYSNRESIKAVVIEKGVTSIGAWALEGCSNLNQIIIPNSVTSVGEGAFMFCCNMSSIDMPNSVTFIGDEAFSGCNSLSKVNIDSLESWLNITFSSFHATPLCYDGELYIADTLVTDLIISEGITKINNYAFSGCGSLRGIIVPDSVTIIGDSAFEDCSSLSSITIPESVTSIGDAAFSGCSKLSSITIPDGVTSIGMCLFAGCSSLNGVKLSENVTTIGNWAFQNCSSLSSIKIPASVTSIGSAAFHGCTSLCNIALPDSMTSIGEYTFYGCSNLSSIKIPEGVTSIDMYTFSGCSSLSSITFPASVEYIDEYAFTDCDNVGQANAIKGSYAYDWCSVKGYIISDYVACGVCGNGKEGMNVIWTLDCEGTLTISGKRAMMYYGPENTPWYSNRTSIKSAIIKDGVTSIGNYAFSDCSVLSSISIPESVTSIGQGAFNYCSSLGDITIPEDVTGIGYEAFKGCSSLSWVVIPDSVTNIGWGAFSGCSSLSGITIPEGVTSIGGDAFSDCSSLSSLTLPKSVTSIDGGAFQNCSSLSSIDLPESLTSIGIGMFENCSSLSNIIIPKSVTDLGSFAFSGCSSLSSITIPDGVTCIDVYAFWNCSSLSNIDLPESIATIGDAAFQGCSSLRSITIPEGVTSVRRNTFKDCSSLRSITIPDGVTSIGEYAFYDCSNLSSITIPDGVTSIDDYAFYHCSSLNRIDISNGITNIGHAAFWNCDPLACILFRGNDMPTLGSSELFIFTTPTIYCYEYSDVDFWALEKGYACVYIDGRDLNNPLSIDLPEEMQLELGESFTVTPTTFPQNATQGIVWESSDPSIVSVEDGVLTAHAVGEATITASCDDISDQMTVRVYAPVESFELSEAELWVVSKQSAQLDICNIEPVGATGIFTWMSADTSVLTVDGGKITALKLGDATVTVTSDNGIVRTCLVHVCYPVTAIELEEREYHLTAGFDAQIIAHVTMRDQSCVNQLVTFTSSDEAVATVDQAGRIHAVSPDTTTITVSATSGVSASCTVTVAPCTHTAVTDPAVPATHVTTGLTEGSHCAVCGEVLLAQQTVPVVKVEKVVLPTGLKTIEAEAFAGNTFVCVVLSAGCETIGVGAFRDCANLRFVEIPDSVTSIDSSAFEGCGDDLIIVTVSGSEAERFANAQGITCVLR